MKFRFLTLLYFGLDKYKYAHACMQHALDKGSKSKKNSLFVAAESAVRNQYAIRIRNLVLESGPWFLTSWSVLSTHNALQCVQEVFKIY
jgi:hypothetical protein